MLGLLFTINPLEFTKGVAEWTWAILVAFWFIFLPLFAFAFLRIFLKFWLRRRREEKRVKANLKENLSNNFTVLEKLSDLRNRGVITEEEFQKKKKEILG